MQRKRLWDIYQPVNWQANINVWKSKRKLFIRGYLIYFTTRREYFKSVYIKMFNPTYGLAVYVRYIPSIFYLLLQNKFGEGFCA